MENTFSDYSRFVTVYDNDSYGTRLPAANKRYAPALALLTEREVKESELKQQAYSPAAYIEYAGWEREVKRPAIQLVLALYERAVAHHPEDAAIWDGYLEFCASVLPKKMNAEWLKAAEKAVRCCPGNGELWAAYMRCVVSLSILMSRWLVPLDFCMSSFDRFLQEKLGAEAPEGTDVESLYARAIGTKLFDNKNATDELVALVEARAGFHRREVDASCECCLQDAFALGTRFFVTVPPNAS
jgi:hypothetical protein